MREEILTKNQLEILPFLKGFFPKFGLVGGTAIALQIGHRRSLDFDLFTLEAFNAKRVQTMVRKRFKIEKIIVNKDQELTLFVNGIKMTFYHFPFNIKFTEKVRSVIRMPNLLTLAAMKAFALGRRSKWKDYVDLYFIFKKYSINEVSTKAEELFGGEFNERLFREQIAYHEDIDHSEEVEFLPDFEINKEEIKDTLSTIAIS